MRVERIAEDKVRIFVSYEDLEERGIGREDMWQRYSGRKVQELFWDMLERAYVEVGFEVAGPISVECYTMPTEGIIVIVERVPSLPSDGRDAEEVEDDDDASIDLASGLVVRFRDFEDVLSASRTVETHELVCTLYHYRDAYYLAVEDLSQMESDGTIAILTEYGDVSSVTIPVLEDYGKLVLQGEVFKELNRLFD